MSNNTDLMDTCCGGGDAVKAILSSTEEEVVQAAAPNKSSSSCCKSGGCAAAEKKTAAKVEQQTGGSSGTGAACAHDNASPHGASHAHENHHHHHHETTGSTPNNNNNKPPVQQADSALCLAVVRENGADVVVFDAAGKPCTFQYKGDIRKLCFKTHGNELADDLLTPCFDQDGNHGAPDEDCFCGVDTPHLHAHLHDPVTCGEEGEEESSCSNSKKAAAATDQALQYLASQTLHPAPGGSDHGPLNIGVTDRMPKECNSEHVGRHDNQNGESSTRTRAAKQHWRRMHKVQHDDHEDYLVHNLKTGDLHLEHACGDCGHEDVHGSFRPVGQRRLKRDGSTQGEDIRLHFFEVAPRPFNILEYIHSAFEPQSDRVAAAARRPSVSQVTAQSSSAAAVASSSPAVTTTKSPSATARESTEASEASPVIVVSSTLICNRICCAGECPVINKTLTPIPGVKKILINVPLKQVIVKHDAMTISAADLEKALNKENMGATVKRDGAAEAGITAVPDHVGRSQFHARGICCASEIPAISAFVEPMPGVKSVTINTTTKTVYVDHELAVVSAQTICDALNEQQFGAEVRFDAATSATSARSTFVQSTLTWNGEGDGVDPDTEVLTNFLRGFDATQMESFFVDVPARRINVAHNPFSLTAQTVAQMLEQETGLVATVEVDGADPEHWKFPTIVDQIDGMEEDETPTYPKPTVILSGIFWIVSMLHYIGGNWDYLKYVGLLSVAFGLPPIAVKAFRTLQRWQFDTNCLMFFASVGAVGLQEFAEAAAVVFLFAISEWLEVRATARARRALSAIVNLRPDKANIVHPTTNELITVPASSVPVGALVSVMTGDKIPCDGVVVEGHSTVDESSLTGESRPIRKAPDTKVSGGTVNSGLSQLLVKTTATSENSAVSRLVRLVEEAQTNRSETEKLVDAFARWYTPVIVIAAVLMCSIPWAFGTDTGKEWTANGLILIVVACPCALIISTPVSYVAGLAATAQRGVLIKGGATLEALGQTKNICFDKTGTLTNGEFALLYLKTAGSLSRVEVLQYLALMEERASHPVAQAIVTAAKNELVTVPKDMILEKHMISAGEGVEGVINNLSVHVGNERLFKRLGLLAEFDEKIKADVESWKTLGGTVGFMSVEGHGIVCAYCAADGVRSESSGVVQRLLKQGVNISMLTGDNKDAAFAIGRQVGLSNDQVKPKLLPEEKLRFVEELSNVDENKSALFSLCGSRPMTIMCGDGVNDAPALAAANIGVAMGAGAALAMETADVTLLDSNLEKLEYSISMGKKVIRKIEENVVFSLVVKFLVLGFALAGKTHLWAAIASDVGAMILVTMNSMMLLPKRQKTADIEALKGDVEQGHRARASLARHKTAKVDTSSEDGDAEVVAIKKSCQKGCCDKKSAAKVSGGGCCSSGACSKSKPKTEINSTDRIDSEKGCCASKSCTKTSDAKKPESDCCASKSCSKKEQKMENKCCESDFCESNSAAKSQSSCCE